MPRPSLTQGEDRFATRNLMVTTRELAIAVSVIDASLDDYPLTLEELQESLVGSPQTVAEVLHSVDHQA